MPAAIPSDPESRQNKDGAPALSDQRSKRVLLICPPFHHPTLSSISTAQLATYLRGQGVLCSEAYLHFELMRILGYDRYNTVTAHRNGSTAELLFAEGLHGELKETTWQKTLTDLFGEPAERRAVLERFENRCLARVKSEEPDIVGLTTSYNQLLPSLWLARSIKDRFPNITIVLGGTGCTEPMGQSILKGYPQVDFAVSGFGEQPLLALGRGIVPEDRLIQSTQPLDFENIPLPDYRPFLREAAEYEGPPEVKVLYQSSRGCWWGQKKHCTFCGLNGTQMAFAAKPSDRVVQEVRTLWEQYGRNLIITDSIMAREHMREALPRLALFESQPLMFCELKANMTEPQVAMLARAGVLSQVGIESLSTRLLKLMKKGVSTIRILALLKWYRERRIPIHWNLLYAIPGERVEDYDEQIALIEKIPHFMPPRNTNPIYIDRYSPYFNQYRDFGWSRIEPTAQSRLAHPHLDEAALQDIAYHFEGVGGVSPEAYVDRLKAATETWKERHERGDGLYLDPAMGLVHNEDGETQSISLYGAVEGIIGCTHRVTPVSRVLEQTRCKREELDQLIDEDVLYVEKDRVVNLTVRTKLPEMTE